MNRLSLVAWLCFSAIGSAQTIPIDSVWSNGIKGTKDIRDLEPPNQNASGERQTKYPVLRSIGTKLVIDRNAEDLPAIVVSGDPSAALLKIDRVSSIVLAEQKMCRGAVIQITRE